VRLRLLSMPSSVPLPPAASVWLPFCAFPPPLEFSGSSSSFADNATGKDWVANRVRDFCREARVIVGRHEQTRTLHLQDQELVGL
jgi:hypothetical protein